MGVSNAPQAGMATNAGTGEEENELNQHERERVIELMLSQERVIALLYEKTFPMTSLEMQNEQDINDMNQLENQLHQEQDNQEGQYLDGEGQDEYQQQMEDDEYAQMELDIEGHALEEVMVNGAAAGGIQM